MPRWPASLDYLRDQYAYLRRDWVFGGALSRRWQQKERAAIKLLPVLALLAGGYEGEGAQVQHSLLTELAGLSRPRLLHALVDLGVGSEIRLLSNGRHDLEHVVVTDCLLATGGQPGFCFSGYLVSDGTWAELEDGECALLLAIAALAESHFAELDVPENIADWLEKLRASYFSESHHSVCTPRICCASVSELVVWTGLDRGNVSRSLAKLCERELGQLLVRKLDSERRFWYHLPYAFWAPPKEVAAQA